MPIRPKLFLKFFVLCLTALLVLAFVNYWSGVHIADSALGQNHEMELARFKQVVTQLLNEDKAQLVKLGRAKALIEYIETRQQAGRVGIQLSTSGMLSEATWSSTPVDLRVALPSLLNGRNHFASVSVFDGDKWPILVAEQSSNEDENQINLKTKDFLSTQVQPDPRVWASSQTIDPLCSGISTASFGATINCTTAIRASADKTSRLRGALVGEIKLDPIFSQAATGTGSPSSELTNRSPQTAAFMVLDHSGKILFHSNEALKHQSVESSMPYFLPVAKQMFASETGRQTFAAPDSHKYLATYIRIPELDASVALASNQDLALADARRMGLIGVVLALVLSSLAAVLLTLNWQRKSRGIERVAKGVEEIAKGKLDHLIELSSDDLKPLADNVGLVTKQLRDQLAREAETRQFQSFVRLSAVLTHDLKNAIEALSLTVTNMEHHFENPDFRVDAMKTLRGATGNLQALVARLSNPVNTLSGEHKMPKPMDLVPMLKRVISMTAEPAKVSHEVRINLPESLIALADVERMDRCVENLIINALEAMSGKVGTLTIEAGKTKEGKPYFSVSDTGEGMSPRFIEEKLFRPFATTKRKGVGLGLYTCREVVRGNGGSIEVDSREGHGTTFRVVLPSAALAS